MRCNEIAQPASLAQKADHPPSSCRKELGRHFTFRFGRNAIEIEFGHTNLRTSGRPISQTLPSGPAAPLSAKEECNCPSLVVREISGRWTSAERAERTAPLT